MPAVLIDLIISPDDNGLPSLPDGNDSYHILSHSLGRVFDPVWLTTLMLLEGLETLWSRGWISILVCSILKGKTNTNTATQRNTKQHQCVLGVRSLSVSYEVTFQWLKFLSSPLNTIASFSADIRKKQYRLFLNAFIRLQYVCKCITFPFAIWRPIRCFSGSFMFFML